MLASQLEGRAFHDGDVAAELLQRQLYVQALLQHAVDAALAAQAAAQAGAAEDVVVLQRLASRTESLSARGSLRLAPAPDGSKPRLSSGSA